MSLPKISHPIFKIKLPSTDKTLRFRPFTVREEKILLVAQSTENIKDILDAILQVIGNCCLDDINIDDLTSFDIDYLFVKLRSRSVNNIVKLEYQDPQTEETVSIEIDLDKVDIKYFDGHEDVKNIKLDDEGSMGITMRYPKPDIVNSIIAESTDQTVILSIFKYCIDTIYDSDTVHHIHDGTHTDEEVNEFIDSLPPLALQKVEKFFETIPRLYHVAEYKRRDGSIGSITLQSLSDFFALG